MNRKFAAGCLALVLTGGTIAAWQIHLPKPVNPDLQDLLSVPKTDMTMHLYGAVRNDATGQSLSGKTLGFDYYHDDGRTLYHVHNILENGASEDIYLRPDGSKFLDKDFFALQDPETLPVLRSIATFAKDGSTYTSHDVKKEDGRLERSGKLLPSGLYQQTYFCDDGVQAHRVRLFDKERNFQSEKLYACQSGILYAEVFPGQYSFQVKVNLRRPDGSLSAALVKDYSGLSGDIFAEDGKTVVANLSGDYSSQTIRFFTAGDKLSQLWYTSFGRTKITTYDPESGLKLWTQEWKDHTGLNNIDAKHLILMKVTEFAQDKENASRREIEMTNDGKSPATVTEGVPAEFDFGKLKLPSTLTEIPDFVKLRSQTQLIHSIDADGKVNKTELSILYQSWNNLVLPPENMPAQIRIEAKLLELPAHINLPSFDDFGPDRVYDYP